MWRSTHLNATSPALGQTLSPKCLYDAELHPPLQPRPRTLPPMIGDQQRPCWEKEDTGARVQSCLSQPFGFMPD